MPEAQIFCTPFTTIKDLLKTIAIRVWIKISTDSSFSDTSKSQNWRPLMGAILWLDTTGKFYFLEFWFFHQYSRKNEQIPIALTIFFTDSWTASLKKLLLQPQSTVYRQDIISVFSRRRQLSSSCKLRAKNKEHKHGYPLVRSRMGNKVRQTATWTAGFCLSIRNAKHATRRRLILVKLLNPQTSLKTDLPEDFSYCSCYKKTSKKLK